MINLIRNYINKITKEDINNYLIKNDIFLNNNELNIIYDYFKNKWYDFLYGDNLPILEYLKNNISESNYNKLYDLYIKTKEKYSNYL